MLVNIEPVIYDAVATNDAVAAYDALKAGLVLVNIDPVTYEAVATKEAVNASDAVIALEELKAKDADRAGFVLVNTEPLTYEDVPANCEVLDPVQVLKEEVVTNEEVSILKLLILVSNEALSV